jgi:hypothetical protein
MWSHHRDIVVTVVSMASVVTPPCDLQTRSSYPYTDKPLPMGTGMLKREKQVRWQTGLSHEDTPSPETPVPMV